MVKYEMMELEGYRVQKGERVQGGEPTLSSGNFTKKGQNNIFLG
jgi:hypothetical protein